MLLSGVSARLRCPEPIMLIIHRSQRAIAAFFILVLLAVVAGGACIAFDAGIGLLSAPAVAAIPAAPPEPTARQEVHQNGGAALEPALPTSVGG